MANDREWVDPAEVAKQIHVPTYDELLEKVGQRLSARRSRMRRWEREIARLQSLRDTVISRTDSIRRLVRLLDGLHPFYWALIEVEFDRERVRRAISCVSKARKVTDQLFEKYRFHLMAAEDPRELASIAREARGRILSLYKRCSRDLELLRSLVVFIQRLPGINPEIPTVIVAGPPSSGKSSFVRSVSRAKPQVAAHPFTTKTVHIGHARLADSDSGVVQVIDTPGILDRPPEEMNPVEGRTAAALRHLPGPVLFLVDPTSDSYMSLERQARLLRDTVRPLVGSKRIYVAVNKADVVPPERVNEALLEVTKADPEAVPLGPLIAVDRESSITLLRRIAEMERIL